MKKRRLLGLGGILAAAALVATACADESGGDGGSDNANNDQPTAVDVAWNQAFYSYNNNTSFGNATANANILYLTQTPFQYYDGNAELQPNEDFGSVELVNEDPTEVKYTIKDGVQWSDGTPVDAADMLLAWAGQSNALNSEGYEPKYNEEGAVVPGKGDDVYFDGGSAALARTAGQVPTIGDDGSMTLHYDEAYADWQNSFWNGAGVAVPAHTVARLALGIDDPEEGKQAIIDAIQNDDRANLKKIADTWNTAFNFTSLPDDEGLYLSFGAYKITEFQQDQFITLEKNEDFTWGPEPSVDTITIKFIADPMAAVQALENGEVDIIQPQATADVRSALEAIDGVTVADGNEGTYEHVDLNIARSKNKGVFEDQRVRQAFLKTLPRQEIVDKLIKPLNPDAVVRDSLLASPDFPNYEPLVEDNGSDAYAEVDIQGAKDLLAEAGVQSPEVCMLYDSTNTRRVNEFELIQKSANQAGFNVTDCGTPDWGGLLGSANAYDAALFGWQSTATGVMESESNFVSDGVNNFYGYNSKTVDDLYAQMGKELDEDAQLDFQKQIEQELYKDALSLAIFQFPTAAAWHESVQNVSAAPLSPTIFWNYWEWDAGQ